MKADRIADQAVKLYEAGLSIDAVAGELKVAYRTARRALRNRQVVLRDPSERLIGRTRPDKQGVTA